ncbi:MAG: hypothetical protein ACK559_30485, partial [bacterium]
RKARNVKGNWSRNSRDPCRHKGAFWLPEAVQGAFWPLPIDTGMHSHPEARHKEASRLPEERLAMVTTI